MCKMVLYALNSSVYCVFPESRSSAGAQPSVGSIKDRTNSFAVIIDRTVAVMMVFQQKFTI